MKHYDECTCSGNSEQHREHIRWEAHRLVDQTAVEVDIGVQLPVLFG